MGLRRVAYVEDEDDIRTLTEISLSAIGGLEVQTYSSAKDALAGLAAFAPDMIMTDVMMPQMDGKELFRRLAADPNLSHIPAVFITAKALSSERAELMDLGAKAVIAKPYDPMTLSDELRAIFETVSDSDTADRSRQTAGPN